MKLSLKLYRFMLRFYPATFRENYAGPLEQEFRDEYGEAPTRWAVGRLWLRTIADFIMSVPAMLVRELAEDARHALRMWIARPLPIVMAILALAIGIGANIGVFSVIDALMLRSLPFKEPERLVAFPNGPAPAPFDKAAEFAEWRLQSAYIEDAAPFVTSAVNLGYGDHPVRIQLCETSWNFFSLMGTTPRAGRAFAAGEDEPAHNTVAVISYGLWQEMFGGEDRALGARIVLNGVPAEVVGVAPPGFDYPGQSQIWTPTSFQDRIPKPDVSYWRITGRLRPGVTVRQASAALEAELKRLPISAPPSYRPEIKPLRDELAGPLKTPSLILAAAVGLLLLIACANVANLLLSRTAERVNELAIRSALGASRGRLVQQLLTESVLLAGLGAVASLIVAQWAVKAAALFQPAGLSTQAYTLIDWRVFAFAAGLALMTGLLFGVAPALFAGSSLVRSAASRPFTSRLRSMLVVVQIALTVILIAGGASLGRAFRNLMMIDNGFETHNVVSLKVSLTGPRYDDQEAAQRAYYDEAIRRIRQLDGVVSAGASAFLPFAGGGFSGGFFNVDSRGETFMSRVLPVTPGFFATLGSRIVAGRDFDESDWRNKDERPAIVNESFARKYDPSPAVIIGRMVTAPKFWHAARIVGVVSDLRFGGPSSEEYTDVFTLRRAASKFVVHVKGDPREQMVAIRSAVQPVDPQIPVFDVKTMEERLDEVTARPRFYTLATVMFGLCALLLSLVGLYGMISYSVAQRTCEMGVRMALGGTAPGLRLTMLRQGLFLVAAGAIPGAIATLLGGKWLEQLVKGATAVTASACLGSLVPIAVVAALSVWTATGKIAKLDPVVALRAE